MSEERKAIAGTLCLRHAYFGVRVWATCGRASTWPPHPLYCEECYRYLSPDGEPDKQGDQPTGTPVITHYDKEAT